MKEKLNLLLLSIIIITVSACTSTNSMTGERGVASDGPKVMRLSQLDVPVDIFLNTEYRGTFVADVPEIKTGLGLPDVFSRDCSGSISIWFYKDSEGALRYYSNGMKADSANCSLPKIGDMADLSQNGMDACAGVDFNYKVVDLNNIAYLREIDFEKKHISAPVCNSPRPDSDTELEYKTTLKLAKFKINGGNNNLHLQITMFKFLKMNYYLTPMINVD